MEDDGRVLRVLNSKYLNILRGTVAAPIGQVSCVTYSGTKTNIQPHTDLCLYVRLGNAFQRVGSFRGPPRWLAVLSTGSPILSHASVYVPHLFRINRRWHSEQNGQSGTKSHILQHMIVFAFVCCLGNSVSTYCFIWRWFFLTRVCVACDLFAG